MKKYTDIFIDFDDTLYDTHGNSDIALHEVFEHFNLGSYIANKELFYSTYWNVNAEVWEKYAKGDISKSELIIERFKRPLELANGLIVTDEFCEKINEKFLSLCSTKPGVVDGAYVLVSYLRNKGYRLHICSNGFREVQYKKLAACGMKDKFDTIILSEDAGVNKPSELFFDYAFKMTGALRDRTIMIGDSLTTDMLGAQRAGIDSIYYKRKSQPSCDWVTFTVTSLNEIMEIL